MAATRYVVVTADRQPGLPPAGPGPTQWRSARAAEEWQPVGVRHALPLFAPAGRLSRTLCGLDAEGWHVWPHVILTGAHGADCMRCAQLAARPDHPVGT